MFNREGYERYIKTFFRPPLTEAQIREAVEHSGGCCGEPETNTSRHYDPTKGHLTKRIRTLLPIYRADQPTLGTIDYVILKDELETN